MRISPPNLRPVSSATAPAILIEQKRWAGCTQYPLLIDAGAAGAMAGRCD